MFKKLFGRKSSNPEPGPQMCMPVLSTATGPTPDAISKAWSSLFPNIKLNLVKSEDGSYSYEADGTLMVAQHMPLPIPGDDIPFAAERSWMWPEAAEEMTKQRSHFIAVAVPSDKGKDPVAEAMALSRLAAAICSASDGLGVYWGNGGQVHSAQAFTDLLISTAEDDMLPVPLWIGVAISGDNPTGPFTLSTHGLEPFGHKELEIIGTTMGLGELRDTIYSVMSYLLTAGPVLKHNDTFGPTPTDKWKVEHTKSQFRPGEPVIRLHVP